MRAARLLVLGCLMVVGTLALPQGSGTSQGTALASTARGPVWTIATSLPAPREYPAVAAGLNGNIYVFGGEDGPYIDLNTTLIYHPTTNRWTQGTNMPLTREGAQAVTLPDGRIAVLGGGTGGPCGQTLCTIYNTVEIYTPSTNRWTGAAPMHAPRYRFAAVLGSDGRIYAIGGWSSGAKILSSVEAYNPRTNRWRYVFSLPQAGVGLAAAVVKGRIVVVGGTDNQNTIYGNVWRYSAKTGWSSGTMMPTPREDLTAATGPDGQLYAIGGYSSSGSTASVEAYNVTTDSWSIAAPLPISMCCLVGTRLSTRIYAIGSSGTQVPVLNFAIPTRSTGTQTVARLP